MEVNPVPMEVGSVVGKHLYCKQYDACLDRFWETKVPNWTCEDCEYARGVEFLPKGMSDPTENAGIRFLVTDSESTDPYKIMKEMLARLPTNHFAGTTLVEIIQTFQEDISVRALSRIMLNLKMPYKVVRKKANRKKRNG